MTRPKISIIVPIYNVEDYVESCLQSIAMQDYEGEIECLLVDDCGSDRSMEIAERFLASYTGKIVFEILRHQKNRGLSAARNTGMDVASGDYIYFLDSDDMVTPECISALTEPLQIAPYDVVTGGVKWGEKVLTAEKNYPMAWNKLYRTQYLRDEHLYFEEGLIHEDELWKLFVRTTAKSCAFVNRITYIYVIREGSIISISNNAKYLAAFKRIHESGTKFILERNLKSNYYSFFWEKSVSRNILKFSCNDSYETFKANYRELSKNNIFSFSDYWYLLCREHRLGILAESFWLLPPVIGIIAYKVISKLI